MHLVMIFPFGISMTDKTPSLAQCLHKMKGPKLTTKTSKPLILLVILASRVGRLVKLFTRQCRPALGLPRLWLEPNGRHHGQPDRAGGGMK
jgi:hypothetical protein